MLQDILRFLLDYLHIIVPSALGLWFLTTLLSSEVPELRTGPCPRCGGSTWVEEKDAKTGRPLKVKCGACRGIGQVRDFQVIKRDVFLPCQGCDATGFVSVFDGPLYPDESPQPGTKVKMQACTEDGCDGGWIRFKDQLSAKRIVPYSKTPPAAPPPEQDAAEEPVVPPAEADGDDDDMPPVVTVPSMFGDDDPPPA